MKKILTLLLIIGLAIISLIIPEEKIFSYAETLNIGSEIKYHYFTEPSAIAVKSDRIAVLDSGSIEFFDTEGNYLEKTDAPKNSNKLLYYGENLFSLADDGIYYNGDMLIEGKFTDFSISENLLFTVQDCTICVYMIDNPASSPTEYNLQSYFSSVRYNNIENLAVKNTLLYFTVPSHINKNFNDIYLFDTIDKTVELVYRQQEKIYALSYNGEDIYAHINKGIIKLQDNMGELTESFVWEDYNLTDFDYADEKIYTLDLLGSVKSIDKFGSSRILIASASDADGFYNMPLAAQTKNGAIIVTDFFNNRVSVITNNKIKHINDISGPITAAADNDNNYYVANRVNSISVFDNDFNHTNDMTVPARIKTIATDGFDNIFVISKRSLFTVIANEISEIDTNLTVNNIYCNSNTGKTYISSEEGIYELKSTDEGWKTEFFSEIIADVFAVDDAENLFILNDNVITCYSNDVRQNSFPTEEGVSYIFLSTVRNEYVNYGDMLIVNPIRHSLSAIPYSEIGAVSMGNGFEIPDCNIPLPNDASTTPMIRILDKDTKLYSAPYDSEIKATLKKGQRVITDYSLSTETFSFILYSDTNTKKLVYGYIHSNSLSPITYNYTKPSISELTVYNENTPIYKYPSVFSATLAKAQKNEKIQLLDFAAISRDGSITEGFYLDDLDYKWLRLKFEDGKEGFIIASDLTDNDIKPQDLYPQINGRIIEYDGHNVTRAYIYDSLTDTFVPTEENLKAGTRIEILDLPFDPTEKYCRILYYKDGVGTIECYVLSNYVKYNSKNYAQYIALGIIIACVVLGLFTFLLIRYNKKRRTLK